MRLRPPKSFQSLAFSQGTPGFYNIQTKARSYPTTMFDLNSIFNIQDRAVLCEVWRNSIAAML